MYSKSLHCGSIDELHQCIESCRGEDFRPTLAIVFCSIKHDLDQIRKVCIAHELDVLGCTTAGEIVDEELHEERIAVMLLDIDRSNYQIKLATYSRTGVMNTAKELGAFVSGVYENPGLIILSGGLTIDAQQLVDGINAALPRRIPVYGGLAGDDLQLSNTYAFTQDGITDHGAAALVLDTDKISLIGLAISGWEPVGGVNVISKAVGNVVYEINDEPALVVFSRYFGLTERGSKFDQLINIQTNYPFQILRDSEHTVLRSPILVNHEAGTITLAASVQEGERFRFSTSPGFEVIEQTVSEFEALHQETPQADALILFSCKGRHGAFGPMLDDEIGGIYDFWQKPMTGFLTYGEFGNFKDTSCDFHNETCVLAILHEK